MRKEYICKNSDLITIGSSLNPTRLREIADQLERDGLEWLSLYVQGHDGYLECHSYRQETDEEARTRIAQGRKISAKNKAKNIEQLKKAATNLGFELVEKK